MKYQVAVFDLDGTLINTLDDLKNSVNFALLQLGFPARSLAEIRAFVGNGIRKLVERAVPENTAGQDIDRCFAHFTEHYKAHMEDLTRPYDGITEMLDALKAAGVPTAVVSNKFDAGTKALVSKFFGERIDIAVGESERVKAKPAPDSVVAVLNALGAQTKNALYIGDSDTDAETAKNAGLPFLGVSWGFRGRQLLLDLGAVAVADKPEQILEYFI